MSAAELRPRLGGRPGRGDLLAGLSVALVLLPQAVAYAVLAGLPPRSGLVVAGVSTVIAAPFVSAPLLQTGPTAITSLLTLGSLASVSANTGAGVVPLAALLALLVGLVRLAIGWRGAGEVAYLVSEPVLLAFTSAAGLVILLSQVPDLLGSEPNSPTVAAGAVEVVVAPGEWVLPALLLGLGAVAVVLLANRINPLVPGVLLAAVAGIVAQDVLGLGVDVVGRVPNALPSVVLDLPWSAVPNLAVPALVIGLVGFSEASAIARSFATKDGRRWSADREFVSQGMANIAAGLVGGMPVGASFSRSAINRTAGARSPWSGVVTGVLVLVALPFADVLASLPQAVLAGIIVAAVVGLVDPRPWFELRHYSRQQFYIAGLTYVLTVLFAPQIQWAVLIGVLLVVAAHLRRERKLEIDADRVGRVLHLHPVGLLHFGAVQRLEDQVIVLLDEYDDVDQLVMHLGNVGRTDVTGALVLRRLLRRAAERGLTVRLDDITAPSRKILGRVLEDDPLLPSVLPMEADDVSSPWDRTPFGTGPRS